MRITSDLGMPEAREYMEKLEKVERVKQLRLQRETDSSQGKRHSANSLTGGGSGSAQLGHGPGRIYKDFRTAKMKIEAHELAFQENSLP